MQLDCQLGLTSLPWLCKKGSQWRAVPQYHYCAALFLIVVRSLVSDLKDVRVLCIQDQTFVLT